MRRSWRWQLVCLFVLVAVVGAVAMLRPKGREFDPNAWQRREQAWDHTAAEMADRLVENSTLQDMKRAQVVRMLGEPLQTTNFNDWDMKYWLGPERGFIAIDSEWLVIRLGPDGRVADYRIVRD